jgi:hypothetical protein
MLLLDISPADPSQETGGTLKASTPQGPLPDFGPNRWTLRDLFLFLGFVPVALFASNLLAAIGYGVLKPLLGWRLGYEALPRNPFFLLALQLVFYGFVLGYLYALVVIHYREPFWKGLGWRSPNAWPALAWLLAGFLMSAVVLLVPPILPDADKFPLEQLFSSRASAYAVGAFAILVAPLMEELLFRGLLFAIFERRVGWRFAVLATAVLFAGLHVPEYWRAWNHILMILLVGVAFSLARGVTGSLAPSVLLHLGYNTSMMIGVFIQTHHFRTLHSLLVP